MSSDFNSLEETGSIDLAHEPSFRLGPVEVRPAFRQLVRGDEEELVEPRVMQVLVALARAKGAIVTRDALVRDCWGGRIVSEDAINRALSRVRRLAEGIGRESFSLETVTKVGYRLVVRDAAGSATAAARETARPGLSRRAAFAGGAVALAAAGVAGWVTLRPPKPPLAPGTDALMQQALIALSQDSREGHNQAIGLYGRVVSTNPDYADGWGALGNAYALAATYRAKDESEALRLRARAAAKRALAIDPANGFAQVAMAFSWPLRGNWLAIERALRRAIAQSSDNEQLLLGLAGMLMAVGRHAEALPLLERMAKLVPPVPELFFFHINLLWVLDRLEEADRLMDQAASLFPTHFAIWFTRFYVLMYSGRASAAIALGANRQGRPSGIRESEIDSVVRVARAIDNPEPALVDQVIEEQLARARQGTGFAENTMQFASALGRVDDAFAVAEAYYFGRGFTVPDLRFSPEEGTYTALGDRMTGILFRPSTRAMRADPRFDVLVGALGLKRYWQDSASRPDYLA
jgi:DNA-binding winged helix-turn-helix (wHTH) protein/tetratricopeptide (TPR) repeat protein